MKTHLKRILFATAVTVFDTSPALALDCNDWNNDFVLDEASIFDVQNCLTASEDLSSLNDLGRTPLISAAAAGRSDIVKLLLDAGADVNAPGAYESRRKGLDCRCQNVKVNR